jgi:hypothetical protein
MRLAIGLLFLLAFVMLPKFSSAETEERIPVTDVTLGVGDVAIEPVDVRYSTHSAPISQMGPEAFRFTDAPAICGRAYLFEAERHARDAVFRVAWLNGCARTGWRVTRRATFRSSLEDYDGLAEWIDTQMDRGRAIAGAPQPEGDERWICMDAAALLIERRRNGSSAWMTGSCGDDHPSTLIEQRLIDYAFNRIGG